MGTSPLDAAKVAVAMAMAVDVAMTMAMAVVVALRRRSIVELTWPRVVQIVLRGISFGMEEHGAMENATGPDVLVVCQKSDKSDKF